MIGPATTLLVREISFRFKDMLEWTSDKNSVDPLLMNLVERLLDPVYLKEHLENLSPTKRSEFLRKLQ